MTDERLDAVCACLRRLHATGKINRARYDRERDPGLPSYNVLRNAGHPFVTLMQRAGLELNSRGAYRREWNGDGDEDSRLIVENRKLDIYHASGLTVVESTVREEVRTVLLPGGVVAQKTYQIASLR